MLAAVGQAQSLESVKATHVMIFIHSCMPCAWYWGPKIHLLPGAEETCSSFLSESVLPLDAFLLSLLQGLVLSS